MAEMREVIKAGESKTIADVQSFMNVSARNVVYFSCQGGTDVNTCMPARFGVQYVNVGKDITLNNPFDYDLEVVVWTN